MPMASWVECSVLSYMVKLDARLTIRMKAIHALSSSHACSQRERESERAVPKEGYKGRGYVGIYSKWHYASYLGLGGGQLEQVSCNACMHASMQTPIPSCSPRNQSRGRCGICRTNDPQGRTACPECVASAKCASDRYQLRSGLMIFEYSSASLLCVDPNLS